MSEAEVTVEKATDSFEEKGKGDIVLNGGKKRAAPSDEESEDIRDQEKIKKKKPKKKHALPPAIRFEPEHVKVQLFVKDLRDLVLYIVGDGRAPNWLAIQNRTAIKRVVSVMIPSLYPLDFGLSDRKAYKPKPIITLEEEASRHLTFFKSKISHIWPVKAPGTNISLHSPFDEFTEVPLSKEEKKKRANQINHKKGQKLKPVNCVLTLQQFVDNNYPIHPDIPALPQDTELKLEEGWIDTKRPQKKDQEHKVFGLDCEMCDAASGKVVTRITLVSHDSKTVYDELVKPDEPITDYLTRYSGITPELLEGVTKSLAEAQQDLLEIVSGHDILVGHSLESDLNVLKIRHPLVIDTAILYGTRGGTSWKPALRNLTHRFLGREIQKGTAGHNSVEDATACLDLLKLKLERGLEFGTKQDTKSIADRLATSAQGKKTTAVIDYMTNKWITSPATLVSCQTDDEVIQHACKLAPFNNFTWTRLLNVHNLRSTDETEEELEEAFKSLNSHLETLYESLPPNTAMLLWTGHGNQKEMRKLQAKKRQYQIDYQTKKWNEIESSWTDKDNQNLLKATELARAGAAFILLKTDDKTDDKKDTEKSSNQNTEE